MQSISATDAKNHFATLIEKAQKQPCVIEKNGRPIAVVLSVEEYEKYSKDDGKEAFLALCGTLAETSSQKGMTGEVLAAILSEKR